MNNTADMATAMQPTTATVSASANPATTYPIDPFQHPSCETLARFRRLRV